MREEIRRANATYRRATKCASYGKQADEYRRLRTQRKMERAVLAILNEGNDQ